MNRGEQEMFRSSARKSCARIAEILELAWIFQRGRWNSDLKKKG